MPFLWCGVEIADIVSKRRFLACITAILSGGMHMKPSWTDFVSEENVLAVAGMTNETIYYVIGLLLGFFLGYSVRKLLHD